MLSRGFHEALAVWPVAVWPLIFSSAFWAFVQLCQTNRRRDGFCVPQAAWAEPLAIWLYIPLGAAIEVAAHGYLLWAIGWEYAAVAIPIYILGRIALPALLDEFGPAMLLLPALHLLFAAALVVLLGLADIAALRAVNAQLYTALTGAPVLL